MGKGVPAWATLLICTIPLARALNNGVGRTPAMGWNSWNFFRCNINEALIREVADAMVANGLRDAGFQYVNIDDCWMEKRGPDGVIVPFKDKFPNGLKPLADYIHSKGLKFGVYSDTGNNTCEGYPGSWGYEKLDAKTYADWGVDYVKYDYCGMDKTTVSVQTSYELMRDALNATGRRILFSLCSWGSGEPHKWGQQVGNSWRTGIDLFAVWDVEQARRLKLPSFLQPISTAIKGQEAYADFAGPGGFNDPDMLVVGLEGMYPYGIVQECPEHIRGCKPGEYISRDRWGRVGGLTVTEQRTHFAFWCMLSAPLILGNDPRHMTSATLDILLAPEVLAVSQDALAMQARKVWSDNTSEIWTKPLVNGRVAALIFNSGSQARDIDLVFSRDMPDMAAKWAREVGPQEGDCVDKDKDGCPRWGKAGECEKNPGFMLDRCPFSCPAGCAHPIEPPGPRASAVVRDAWLREDLGAFTSKWNAHLVEPHAARVVTLTFMEPAEAAATDAKVKRDQAEGRQTQRARASAGAVAVEEGGRKLVESKGSGGQALSSNGGGDSEATVVAALQDEVQVLRDELSRSEKALDAEKLAAAKASEAARKRLAEAGVQAARAVVEAEQATVAVAAAVAEGGSLLSSTQGKVLLASNVLLAITLLSVLRSHQGGRSGGRAKQGEYKE